MVRLWLQALLTSMRISAMSVFSLRIFSPSSDST